MPLGLGPKDLFGLLREAQAGPPSARPLLVRGPRAGEVVAAVTHGGDTRLATTAGDGTGAGAVVLLLETRPVTGELELLRRATRSGTPTVAVKLSPFPEPIPYVLPEDVLDTDTDDELPIETIVAAVVRRLPDRGAALAARLPVVRAAALERQSRESAVIAGTLAAFANRDAAMLGVLALAQARMLTRLETSAGAATGSDPVTAGRATGQSLGTAVGLGLVCRSLVRRLPVKGRLVDGAVAAAGTYALLRLHRLRNDAS